MPLGRPRTRIEIEASRSAREGHRAIGMSIRRLREDAGVSQVRLAAAAGISQGHESEIESGAVTASDETLHRIAIALGGRYVTRIDPGISVPLRDHIQARMLEALLARLDTRWRRHVEVPVYRPVRGVIDLVLHDPDAGEVVVCEAQSQLRRLEQQIRWAHEKAAALMSTDPLALATIGRSPLRTSSLLLLRSTRANRVLAQEFESTFRAAYPGVTRAAVRSLTGPTEPWPGSSLVWASVEEGATTILAGAARGAAVGR
jgi:transcriptional regulator with XRE-family HTH domain